MNRNIVLNLIDTDGYLIIEQIVEELQRKKIVRVGDRDRSIMTVKIK